MLNASISDILLSGGNLTDQYAPSFKRSLSLRFAFQAFFFVPDAGLSLVDAVYFSEIMEPLACDF